MRLVIAMGALALTVVCEGCGDGTEFGGKTGQNSQDATAAEPPPDGDPAATAAPFASLTWYFQCDKSPATPPAAKSPKDKVVVGAGPFSFEPGQLQSTPITFAGHLCPPAQEPRDVVFLIDVSGSMTTGDIGGTGNDPLTNNSCGRLQAIESVVASIPKGTAKFSIVTFSSDVVASSTGFFADQDSLFKDIAGGDASKISGIVCNGDGATNYQAGLAKAGQILSGGRDHATKEIYFVSDGQPTAGDDGIDEATTLKTPGVTVSGDKTPIPVTIATVMLNGTDQVLEKSIASKDDKGKPLHQYAKDSSALAKALTELAANGIASGDIKWAPAGTDHWTTIPLAGHLQGYDFTMPSITIDPKQAPQGLDVVFEYVDKHNDKYSSGGKLLWQASSGDGSTN